MIRKRFLFLCGLLALALSVKAQSFTEIGKTYPVNADGNKYAINGFIQVNSSTNEKIYANALLWVIENICPKLREGITDVDVVAKKFSCKVILTSIAGTKQSNIYYMNATFKVADGKLIYYLSDVEVESTSLVMKRINPLEKLTPEKKISHKQTMDDFIQSESLMLNKMFDFVTTNQPTSITHWDDISISRPVKGMTEDECRMAFGKPQSIMETNDEIQWMYTSSFYLFFKNGYVQTIIK